MSNIFDSHKSSKKVDKKPEKIEKGKAEKKPAGKKTPKKKPEPAGKKQTIIGAVPLIEGPEGEQSGAYEWDERGKKKATGSEQTHDMENLVSDAARAQLMEIINKVKIQEYKIEKEKMEIEAKAKNTMELSFGEFLFFGYLEKLNTGLLGMMKRNRPRYENLFKENDYKGFEKAVQKEIKATLIDVKKQQVRDARAWKREK